MAHSRLSRYRRRWALTGLACAALVAGCSSSRQVSTAVAPSDTSTGALAPTTTANPRLGTVPPSPTALPPVTEPDATVARLRPILLGQSDLPAGFGPAVVPPTGDASAQLRPCGRAVVASGGPGDITRVAAAFDRNGGREHVFEEIDGFNRGDPRSLVDQIRQVRDTCPKLDAMVVTPIAPPAVGEDVAGVRLAGSNRFVDIAIVRSGPLVAVVIITESGRPVPDATMTAIVTAAGTKLAVGTGG